MAGTGTKLLFFLIAAHALLFGAGQYGFLQSQSGTNPHKAFLGDVQSGSQQGIGGINGSSTGSVDLATRSVGFINAIGGVLVAPYSLLLNVGMPTIFKLILASFLAVAEGSVIVSFIRGVDLF